MTYEKLRVSFRVQVVLALAQADRVGGGGRLRKAKTRLHSHSLRSRHSDGVPRDDRRITSALYSAQAALRSDSLSSSSTLWSSRDSCSWKDTIWSLLEFSSSVRIFSWGTKQKSHSILPVLHSHGRAKEYNRRQSRAGSSALLRLGLVQQVWRERVKFSQLVEREVPLDLLLVHHSVGQRLFGHLPVIDLFLHGALQTENNCNDLRESNMQTICEGFYLKLNTIKVTFAWLVLIFLHKGAVRLPEPRSGRRTPVWPGQSGTPCTRSARRRRDSRMRQRWPPCWRPPSWCQVSQLLLRWEAICT